MPFSNEEFFEQGLNFSAEDSQRLAKITKLVCIAMGGILGTSLALSTINPSGANAPGNIKLLSALAGLFVGGMIGATSCMAIRSKIIDFLDSVRDMPLSAAISTLTPAKREELRSEARRLLSMESRIMEFQREMDSGTRTSELSA